MRLLPVITLARPLTLAAALAVIAASAGAQVTTYASRAAWQSAVGSASTETFSMNRVDVPTAGGTYTLADLRLVFDANHGDLYYGGGDMQADAHAPGGGNPQFFRFEFAPTTGFAADFSGFDAPSTVFRLLIAGQEIALGQGFFGATATTAFSSAEIRIGSGASYFRADNVSLATQNVIPEPSTYALLGAGLLVVGGVAARRRRATV